MSATGATDAPTPPGLLEARNLSLAIEGRHILQGLNCRFPAAQITVLSGPNGSGKTMFLELLAGLRRADEGEVLLNGEAYPQKGQPLGTGVGLVFQQPEMQIVEQTVEEDILFGLKNISLNKEEQQKRLEESLRWSGLHEHRHQYPQTLSGGELRRLALAGVIAMGPQFVLLDEPFENLDYPGVRETLRQILMLRQAGKGVVLVVHDLGKCLAHADHLVILCNGQIAAAGRPGELLHCLEDHDVRRPQMPIEAMTWA